MKKGLILVLLAVAVAVAVALVYRSRSVAETGPVAEPEFAEVTSEAEAEAEFEAAPPSGADLDVDKIDASFDDQDAAPAAPAAK